MNGSEKQIKWATEIIEQEKSRTQSVLSEARLRYEHLAPKSIPDQLENETLYLRSREIACSLVLSQLDTLDNATYIIDNRGSLRIKVFESNFKSLSSDDLAILQALAKIIERSQFYGFLLS